MPKKRSFVTQISSSNQVCESFLKTICWFFLKPHFYLFNFNSFVFLILLVFFRPHKSQFWCSSQFWFQKTEKTKRRPCFEKKIVLFHRSRKKSTTTFGQSWKKMYLTNQKEQKHRHAQKNFQNPGWKESSKSFFKFVVAKKRGTQIIKKKASWSC